MTEPTETTILADAELDAILAAIAPSPELDDAGEPAPWQQHNTLFNQIADAQGIEPGSWEWLQGGVAAWSGQSGEHASYGWRHHHKAEPAYIRAVIANYGHRRTYYSNAPYRGFGYSDGGRPKGWAPEVAGDKPDGSCDYLTKTGIVTVSGPEAEHFWLDPLWAVIDSPAVMIKTPWGLKPSGAIAGTMAKLQLRSIMGAIRDPAFQFVPGGSGKTEAGRPYPWTYGDRANSRILDTWLQAVKRGAIEEADINTGYQFIWDVLLPHYEASPGISSFGNAPLPSQFPVGTYNGLYWLLPVFYDASLILPNTKIKARFEAIVKRYSQWALDLEETVPGRGFDMSRFYVDKTAFVNVAKPLESIKELLHPKDIIFDLGWDLWSLRACSVAAKVTGSPTLRAAERALLQKHGGNFSKKKWVINADREYAILQPIE